MDERRGENRARRGPIRQIRRIGQILIGMLGVLLMLGGWSGRAMAVPIGGVIGTMVPRFQADPSALDFGNVTVGTTSTQSVTISNPGSAPLVFDVAISGPGFTVASAPATTVQPDQSTSMTVAFKPAATGPASGTLTFTTNLTTVYRTVSLSGAGVAAQTGGLPPIVTTPGTTGPIMEAPSSFDAGGVSVGDTVIKTIVIKNRGSSNLVVSGEGLGDGGFQWNSYNVFPSYPDGIPPGGTLTLYVRFQPVSGGPRSATLVLDDNTLLGHHSITLTGTGLVPELRISPTRLDFADQQAGTQSAPQPVTVTNVGDGTWHGNAAAVGLGPIELRDFFCLSSLGDTQDVAPGQSLTFQVRFQPQTPGPKVGNLMVLGNTLDLWQLVSLSGNATAPPGQPAPAPGPNPASPISVSPTGLDFGPAPVGLATGVPRTITLTNRGSQPIDLNLSTWGLNDDDKGSIDFRVSPADRGPLHLLPGASRDTTVLFNPSTVGVLGAVLRIDTPAPPYTLVAVPLTGVGGTPSDLAVLAIQAQPLVSRSAGATVRVLIANHGGVSSSFHLRLTVQPLNQVIKEVDGTLQPGVTGAVAINWPAAQMVEGSATLVAEVTAPGQTDSHPDDNSASVTVMVQP
jgi:ASPM-SPD-2-Hydin domain-containing protein/centrosomal CEP192-like protein